jgi:hypothetical protein
MNARDEYAAAVAIEADVWVAACGGTEVPCGGYLYVFNPSTRATGWLNLGTDIVENENPFQLDNRPQ